MTSRLELLTVARALFAWWVVAFHFKEWVFDPLVGKSSFDEFIGYGYLGVDFFFVLSGFVIDRRYGHSFSAWKFRVFCEFVLLRLARLYPLHIVLLLLMAANPIALLLFSKAKAVSDQYSFSYFIQSVFLVQNWGFGNALSWNTPAWSISAELFAYLLYPLIGFLLCKQTSNRPLIAIAVACISLISIILFYRHLSLESIGDQVTRSGTIRCLLEFTLGCTCSRITKFLCGFNNPRRFIVPLVIALGFLVSGTFALRLRDFVTVPSVVFLSILLISIIDTEYKVKVPSWLILLGNISYATYLCHWVIKSWFIHSDLFVKLDPIVLVPTYCLTVLVCSYFLYKYVESPAQNFFSKKIKPSEQLSNRIH